MSAFDPDKRESVLFLTCINVGPRESDWSALVTCPDPPLISEAKAVGFYNAGYMLPHVQYNGVL